MLSFVVVARAATFQTSPLLFSSPDITLMFISRIAFVPSTFYQCDPDPQQTGQKTISLAINRFGLSKILRLGRFRTLNTPSVTTDAFAFRALHHAWAPGLALLARANCLFNRLVNVMLDLGRWRSPPPALQSCYMCGLSRLRFMLLARVLLCLSP